MLAMTNNTHCPCIQQSNIYDVEVNLQSKFFKIICTDSNKIPKTNSIYISKVMLFQILGP